METRTDGEPAQRLIYAPGLLGPVAGLETQDHPETRFIYASRINVPDYMVRGGQTFRLVTDQLGSVRVMISVARYAILDMGSDDDCGLYEVIWALKTSHPDAHDVEMRSAARTAITALLEEGKVAVHAGTSEGPASAALSLPDALAAISIDDSWDVGTPGGLQYWFGNLPLGDDEYFGNA